MSQMLQRQIARLHAEAQSCREVASRISLRAAAEPLLERARAFERQAASLEAMCGQQQAGAKLNAQTRFQPFCPSPAGHPA